MVVETRSGSTDREANPEFRLAESLGLPAPIAPLLRTDSYPHRTGSVQFVQTHISWVFLAGEYVYKIKKPVRFAFLDSSSLPARRKLCLDEVRLNQRLAHGIYLGVAPIVKSGDGFALGAISDDAQRSAVEYAVVMRRLPGEKMLDHLLARGAVGLDEIRAISRRLVQFHARAAVVAAQRYGSAAAVTQTVMGNLAECERLEGYTVGRAQLKALIRHTSGFLRENWQLVTDRSRLGRVVEGHGDLRCEHICMSPGGIVVFGCVEFSEALRYGDVASDIAFLAMDLDRLGAPQLSAEVAATYASATGDTDFTLLLPFYKSYRAAVRAKVESLRSLQAEVPSVDRDTARDLARRYFAMACDYARCYNGKPVVIVVCGTSGTGKSTTARLLGRRLGFEVVSSDEVRKRMAGVTPTTSLKASYEGGIYSKKFTERTYNALFGEARLRLEKGAGVILDATFRHPGERGAVIETAAQSGASVLFVECRAGEEEVMRRLHERSRLPGSVSDADESVFLRQRSDFVPLGDIPSANRIVADTVRGYDEINKAVEEALDAMSAV